MPAKQMKNTKRGRKADNGAKGIVGLTRNVTLFPDKMMGKMSYASVFTFPSIAATSMQATVMRWNSVYDPDFTGTGTAAAGYSAASSLYGRYRVVATEAELTFLPLTNTVTAFAVLSCDSTLGTDYGRLAAQRHTWTRALVPGGTGQHHKISAPVAKIFGVPAAQVTSEDDFAGLVGGNPNNQVFLHIGAYNPNASVATIQVTVRMVFTVLWSLPLSIPMP